MLLTSSFVFAIVVLARKRRVRSVPDDDILLGDVGLPFFGGLRGELTTLITFYSSKNWLNVILRGLVEIHVAVSDNFSTSVVLP